MSVTVNVESFHERLKRIYEHWQKFKSPLWGDADALCIPIPKFSDDDDGTYSRTKSLSLYLLGYEFPATVIVLTRTEVHILATEKKIRILTPLAGRPGAVVKVVLHTVTKDDGNAGNFASLVRAIKGSHVGSKLGSLVKDAASHPGVEGNLAVKWMAHASDRAGLAVVEASKGFSAVLAQKDATELGLVKKAAVMSNKVLKHGFVKGMEELFEQDGATTTHSAMAQKLDDIMEDPAKIGIKVPADTIESCYFPIVQSGGCKDGYSLKPSASSDDGTLSEDVVVVSLGAKYAAYCANVARTYLIDATPTVEKTYMALVKVRAECLAAMQVGSRLADVHKAATAFLGKRHAHLLPCLPKSLGWSLGLDFKDPTHVLSAKVDPALVLKPGMVFNLVVGFANVPLPPAERAKAKGSVGRLDAVSMQLADTVAVAAKAGEMAEVLTKASVEWNDVSYTIKEEDEEDEDEGDEGGDEDGDEGEEVKTVAGRATVLKSRLRERAQVDDAAMEARVQRAEKQARLFQRAQERGLRGKGGGGGKGGNGNGDGAWSGPAEDLEAYALPEHLPYEAKGNMLHVDMDNESVLVPIQGVPVPFHISTIKNVSMPEKDSSHYLRLNFYTPGQALGKECAPQMAALVAARQDQAWVKELSFRSASASGLTQAYRLLQELRKRAKAKAAKEEQAATLVVQAKLVRLKDQRVPRLADIEMRPALSGRKSKGTLDAHTNGLRFTSAKTGEHVDVMYANVKHAFFQPCHGEHIVLVHFHLKDFILVGKKKTVDVQFITEVVEASEDVGARGSAYDPDEVESEQRERKMKKALNLKFKQYTEKVEEVARRHGFDHVEFDIPYRDLAFQGTPHREMVTLQPTVHCLVNLTETPAFVVPMDTVEHVHFERCTMAAKNFDLVFIFKNHDEVPRMVSMIDIKDLDDLQEWLTQQDKTFTTGTVNFNWKQMMLQVKGFVEEGSFWEDEDEVGESKPVGWRFLDVNADDDEDGEDDEDDEENEEYQAESSESSEDDDIEEDEDESFDEEDEESDFDEEEEEEAEGQDWDELEQEAKSHDRQRDTWEAEEDKNRPKKKSKSRH